MIRRILCLLGRHEWHIRREWRINIEKGTTTFCPRIWCKHCGKVKK